LNNAFDKLDDLWINPRCKKTKRKRGNHLPRVTMEQDIPFNDQAMKYASFPAWGWDPEARMTFESSVFRSISSGSPTGASRGGSPGPSTAASRNQFDISSFLPSFTESQQ
jgi:hypothetical protein